MSFNECSDLINLDPTISRGENFFQFVYGKISRDTKNRDVTKGSNHIDVIPFDSPGVRVIPSFKDINMAEIKDLDDEIKEASNIINKNNHKIRQVYIVCPKNKNFSRHIELRIPELEERFNDEYKIKIIPYSLGSIQRKQKAKCCGNC